MTERARILWIPANDDGQDLPIAVQDLFDITRVSSWDEALSHLSTSPFDGVLSGTSDGLPSGIGKNVFDTFWIVDQMPQGMALVDQNQQIKWANQQLHKWADLDNVIGLNLYTCLGDPELLGPDLSPCISAVETKEVCNSVLRVKDNVYFRMEASSIGALSDRDMVLVVFQDISKDRLYRMKLDAIHEAGIEMANLRPEEIFQMEVEDRIDLLKSNILHYTQSLLNYEYIEVRLLDQKSGKLRPLISSGIDKEAAERSLEVGKEKNGVTGFVAATGQSYLCADTGHDPLYIPSFSNAKSSLTVPLKWQKQVVGTFNVESPEASAFSESDLHFLELFARNVAVAINTLDLLIAQQTNTAQKSVEAIHSQVALPIDKILNETVNIMERYIGHEPEVADRLKRILRNARDIRQVIHKVGQSLAPAEAVPEGAQIEAHPLLTGKHVLVVDADETVRNDAHGLLARYGCVVETAESGSEAVNMVRNSTADESYSAVIADIALPDMSGYELLIQLQETLGYAPLILMTGFGYDPDHSIVKARQAGLHENAVLYKPFRLDQLIETVEMMVQLSTSASGQ